MHNAEFECTMHNAQWTMDSVGEDVNNGRDQK